MQDSNTSNLAVIILNFFGFDDTVASIKSVRNTLHSTVFLVDNSADPSEKKKLENTFNNRTDIKLIFPSENVGFAAGVNLGLQEAVASGFHYFLLLNNDAFLTNDAGDVFAKAFKDHPGSIISPTIVWGGNISKENYYQKYLGLISIVPYFHGFGSLQYFTGCALGFDKNVLNKIGFLDESFFFFGEDVEYCYRAIRNNVPLKLLPEKLVNHAGSKSARTASFFYEYHLIRSHYLLSKKTIEYRIYMIISLVGKLSTLSLRAFIRCLRYRSLTPLIALMTGIFPLRIRPQKKQK